jgi:A/G-specific adenine glycosylase
MSTVPLVVQTTKQMISQKKIKEFQQKIFTFYKNNRRDLPWRNTTDPYKILVSEVMLQQTQVSRVVSFYEKWIQAWPTVFFLASAKRAEVLSAWMGLGYNTRAMNLHNAAKKIVHDFHGDVLGAMRQFKEIPGVGRYTSQAVQIFSTNGDLVTVDTNIRRIFISEFHLLESVPEKELWMLAERCLPKGRSREWHNALMDYGAMVLTSKQTGIRPKTQQKRFDGSDRQIRALMLRSLLHTNLSLSELERLLQIEQIRLKKILEKMIAERIIVHRNHKYKLNE